MQPEKDIMHFAAALNVSRQRLETDLPTEEQDAYNKNHIIMGSIADEGGDRMREDQ